MAPTAIKDCSSRNRSFCDIQVGEVTTRPRRRAQLSNFEAVVGSQKPEQLEGGGTGALSDCYKKETNFFRILTLFLVCLSLYHKDRIQFSINALWDYLRFQPFFFSAYFESVYVTVVYGLIIAFYPYTMHYISLLSKFKVKEDVTYVHQTVLGMMQDAIVYMAPLLFADAVIQKKYWGVPEREWAIRSEHWIQTTRALPAEPPNFLTLCLHVAGSVVVFDALFFLVHLTLHKNAFLYRHIHALHHRHGPLHAHVTNQLTFVERGAIVAAANYSLKLFGAHPLTRLVFVVVFLWLLVDNHTGYDLPWSPHRLAPAGLMGGPAAHHAHHTNGARHYQPFFTYLDAGLERWDGRKVAELSLREKDIRKPSN